MDLSPRHRFWMAAIFAMAFISFVFSLFVMSQQMMRHSDLMQFNQRLIDMTRTEQQLSDQIQAEQATQSASLMQLQKQLAVTHAMAQSLQSVVGSSANAWQIQEAFHLIRMAYYVLNFEKNIPETITLLKTANQTLALTHQARLIKLQALLSNDISLLETAPSVDLPATYLRIEALRKEAHTLPVVPTQFTSREQDNLMAARVSEDRGFEGGLEKVLSRIFIIRRHDAAVSPLLSSQEQQALRLTLQSLFLQAEWGLLHHQAVAYQTSLENISELLSDYYVINNPEIDQIQKTLTALEMVDVSPNLPDLSDLLTVVDAKKTAKVNAPNGEHAA